MPRITLINIKGNSYICSGVLSIGVYIDEKSAILIDSGGDENCAKDVYVALQNEGIDVAAIVNTHCHPDHCGGNAFFQKKNAYLKVYASYDEQRFIEDPLLAPRCFCMQAAPFAGLLNKYIAPQKASVVTNPINLLTTDQSLAIDHVELSLISLPGHTPGSLGVITPDNVLYCGDAVFGEEVLAKHQILFYTDIRNTLQSLQKLNNIKSELYALYHGGIGNDLRSLVKQHETRILSTKEVVVRWLSNQPLSVEMLTQKIMQQYAIPNNMVALTLTQTTLRAYLAYLEETKIVHFEVTDGLLWACLI